MSTTSKTWTVLVFSENPRVRERVKLSVGRRPAGDVGLIDYVDAATGEDVISLVDAGGVDVAILDGEAWPCGGLGISRQMKDEMRPSPATVVIVARRADKWLAVWSQCDAVLSHPLDPLEAAATVAELLRGLVARVPASADR